MNDDDILYVIIFPPAVLIYIYRERQTLYL